MILNSYLLVSNMMFYTISPGFDYKLHKLKKKKNLSILLFHYL